MLKISGYISYLYGLGGVVYLIDRLTDFSTSRAYFLSEYFEILIFLIPITQIFFTLHTLKRIAFKEFKKSDSLDELMLNEVSDNSKYEKLALVWRIFGWTNIGMTMIVSLSLVQGIAAGMLRLNLQTQLLVSILVMIAAIFTFFYDIRVVEKRWIVEVDDATIEDEL